MRCSGHESFACRYAWIPKAVEAIQSDPLALDDEDGAMVELGVGRNMVRSIRFWVQAFGVTAPAKKGLQLTAFGKAVFGRRGLDPYLEDARTLWLLHWNLASNRTDPLFAWDFLLSKWPKPEFTRKEILAAAVQALRSSDRAVSAVTLEQHIDIFLRTYCASPADGDALEDELDSPLVQIRLVEAVLPQGTKSQRDAVYSLSVEEKQGVSAQMFTYCLEDFWRRLRSTDKTLSFRDIAFAAGAPGTVFRIPEQAIRTRLETIEKDSEGLFEFSESAAVPSVRRMRMDSPSIKHVYATH